MCKSIETSVETVEVVETVEQVKELGICSYCGRPFEASGPGKGRKKESHKTCSIVRSRVAELERLLSTMEFGSKEDVKRVRGDLFAIVNNTLHPYKVAINPDNTEDI